MITIWRQFSCQKNDCVLFQIDFYLTIIRTCWTLYISSSLDYHQSMQHCFRWLLWRITWPQQILWCQWRYPVGSPRSRTRGSGPALPRRWIPPHISPHRGALQSTLSSLLKENNFKDSNFRTFTRSQFTIFFSWVTMFLFLFAFFFLLSFYLISFTFCSAISLNPNIIIGRLPH